MKSDLIFCCRQEGSVIFISKCFCSATTVPVFIILMHGHV